MYTTLEYEAQKAVIQERLRHAALRQQLPRRSWVRSSRHLASLGGNRLQLSCLKIVPLRGRSLSRVP
jgi:hypothetical protein